MKPGYFYGRENYRQMNDNTESIEHIDHDGVVVAADNARKFVKVRLTDNDDCAGCPAATLCAASGDDSNEIIISTPCPEAFRKGDIVTVRGTEKMHRKAVVYATVFPCIILVAVMVAVYLLTFNQLAAALSGLGVMFLMFFLLWILRDRIAHEFSFTIVGRPERPSSPQR